PPLHSAQAGRDTLHLPSRAGGDGEGSHHCPRPGWCAAPPADLPEAIVVHMVHASGGEGSPRPPAYAGGTEEVGDAFPRFCQVVERRAKLLPLEVSFRSGYAASGSSVPSCHVAKA